MHKYNVGLNVFIKEKKETIRKYKKCSFRKHAHGVLQIFYDGSQWGIIRLQVVK